MTKRILVVEDQEDLRGVLRTLLTGSGYEMLEAVDGQDGVAKAKSDPASRRHLSQDSRALAVSIEE
jgi:CheY-like chemotaxis protein